MTLTLTKPVEHPLDTNSGWAAEVTFHVRYAETDQMGIVHHSAYVPWLEEARSALSRQYGRPYADFERAGYGLAVTELHLRFITPARYDQAVTVRVRVSKVRSRQVDFEYAVVDATTGECLATGYTMHVCIDKAGRPVRIPPEWQTFWASLKR
ncbi:MAG: acyl-CoA thioesterase [Anaerolineae bacterium]